MKTILFALLCDHFIGDPPNQYHPVAWMGTAIGKFRRWGADSAVVQTSTRTQLAYGILVAGGGGLLMWWIGRFLRTILNLLPFPVALLLEGWLLKIMFSLSGLTHAASEVAEALQKGDLTEARRLVSWHLVSRDTSELDDSQLAAATIESVAENLSDGVIAPLLYYSVFGLSGAIAYRYVNTCDAMLGYRDEEREWLGKGSARLDDLLNVVPARLTAVLLLAAGTILDGFKHGFTSGQKTWQRGVAMWQRDARTTDSPNAGHPMSATAGVMGVSLEKVGQYNLGAGQEKPQVEDIGRVIRLVQVATALACLVLWLLALNQRRKDEGGNGLYTQ